MIVCESCGEPLIDELDVDTLTVEGEEIPFRRTSDFIACQRCGTIRSIRSIRAEAAAHGDLVDPTADLAPVAPDSPLEAAAAEALSEIHQVAGVRDDEDSDVLLSALSDLASDEEAEAD